MAVAGMWTGGPRYGFREARAVAAPGGHGRVWRHLHSVPPGPATRNSKNPGRNTPQTPRSHSSRRFSAHCQAGVKKTESCCHCATCENLSLFADGNGRQSIGRSSGTQAHGPGGNDGCETANGRRADGRLAPAVAPAGMRAWRWPTPMRSWPNPRPARARGASACVGRKIGFTNTTIWPLYGVSAPMWNFMYDTHRPRPAGPGAAASTLAGLAEPRIEPEIVLRPWPGAGAGHDARRRCSDASTGWRTASRSCSRSIPAGSSAGRSRRRPSGCTGR